MLPACQDLDVLQEHPKKVDASTFMTDAAEIKSVINSIYYQFRRDVCFGRYIPVLGESLSDYCYGRGNYATSYTTGLTSGAVSFSKDTWAVLYRAIRFANEIIPKFETAEMSAADYKALMGEVRYLRAFSYSYLVRLFGAVPFFDEHNMAEFSKPRTPEKEIWNFVASEAREAADMLPKTPAQYGRPTRYAALMLLTEASLYLERWEEAAAASGEVVGAKRHGLVQVTVADDFQKIYGTEANGTKEEIFYFKYNTDDGNKFFDMYLCRPNPVRNGGNVGIYTDYKANAVIANWDKNDLRYQYNLYIQTENGTLNSLTKTGMICLKYRDYNATGAAMDLPVYRYADALLYCAEAICRRDGKPNDEALEMINKVRRRAYGLNSETPQSIDYKLSDYNSSDKFIELLLKEKAYETMFEGKRYLDLKRMGKLAEYALKAGRIKDLSEVGQAAYWWPIPADEFIYNDMLDPAKDQNPGY